METNIILQGDALTKLKEIPDESINCVMTSPPYWSLRDYGKETESIWDGNENCEHDFEVREKKINRNISYSERLSKEAGKDTKLAKHETEMIIHSGFCQKCGAWKGQLGLEPDFKLYIKHLCDIFDEVKRVLRKDGTCWVNIGDTYYTKSGSGFKEDNITGNKADTHYGLTKANELRGRGLLQSKNLTLIPFRFAIEMQDSGWILRNNIIWHKRNCMPSSVKDRFTVDFEYVFFFVKNRKYWFETQREPHKESSIERTKHPWDGHREPMSAYVGMDIAKMCHPQGRNKRTVWEIGSKYEQMKEGHSNRAGLQREPTLREKRIHEVIQIQIANYLRKHLTKPKREILDKEFGKHKWTHWIRTDDSGASLPSPEDWFNLKKILGFDNTYDDIMTETEVYLDDGMMWKNREKNKRTVWTINPKPFKEAHFAVYPEELCETPIKAGCPEFVCSKCGNPKVKVLEHNKISEIGEDLLETKKTPYSIQERKGFVKVRKLPDLKEFSDYLNEHRKRLGLSMDTIEDIVNSQAPHHWFGAESYPSIEDYERLKDILELGDIYDEQMTKEYFKPAEKQNLDYSEKGYKPTCNCNAGFIGGIVLDPFFGAGTTGLVALKQNKKFIGIELNKEYIEIANKRLKPFLEQKTL